MASSDVIRSEPIDTGRILIPAGQTVTLYDKKWASNIEKLIRRIKVWGPVGTTITYYDASGNLLNPDAQDIGSFPHDYQQALSLGASGGGQFTVKAIHPYAVAKYVQVRVDMIRNEALPGQLPNGGN